MLIKVRLLILLAFAISLSGCKIEIEDTKECAVAGVLSAGMNCAWRISGETSEMTLDQTIEFLEPQPERPDPANPKKMLPARAGAICRSAEDARKQQTALKQACRKLGKACTLEMRELIATDEKNVGGVEKKSVKIKKGK